jgi:hypothetical protein
MSSLLYERGRRGQDPLVLGAAFVLPEEEIRRPGYFGLLAGRKVFAIVLLTLFQMFRIGRTIWPVGGRFSSSLNLTLFV